MGRRDYRLVWLQHFHKAAGSSIVEIAQLNGERCYPAHANGNPLDATGKAIALWDYTKEELLEFIDSCEAQGITFMATQWRLRYLAGLIRRGRFKQALVRIFHQRKEATAEFRVLFEKPNQWDYLLYAMVRDGSWRKL